MKNTIKSVFAMALLAISMAGFTSCTDREVVCAIITLERNEPCRQAQLAAQNEYNMAADACNDKYSGDGCSHIFDPAARAACVTNNLNQRMECKKAAKAKLDAVNLATERCYAANKVKYDECMAGN
jgi:hypothetical protein